MVEWVKVGTDVVVGGGLGAVDQLVQNWDERREEEKAEKLGVMAQAGTYYNYGVPILSIVGAAMGWLRGDWATRLIVSGSTLAGRKVAWQVTKRREVASWAGWTRNSQLEAKRRAQLEAARRARPQVGGDVSPIGIPVITDETVLV